MFDIFGEFNSAEEINVAAAAQLQEGDTDAVMTIARENGIDEDDAQDYIDGMVAVAVRTKGKSIKGCIAALLKWSFTNSYDVDKNIVKQAGIRNSNVKMGIPGMATAYKLIDEYYLGGGR